MCAFVVFSFSIPSQDTDLGNVSKMTYFVSSGITVTLCIF